MTVTFAPCVTCDVRHVMCVMLCPDMTLVQSDIEFQLGSARWMLVTSILKFAEKILVVMLSALQ